MTERPAIAGGDAAPPLLAVPTIDGRFGEFGVGGGESGTIQLGREERKPTPSDSICASADSVRSTFVNTSSFEGRFASHRFNLSHAARMKPLKTGAGLIGLERYSGWNWVATK